MSLHTNPPLASSNPVAKCEHDWSAGQYQGLPRDKQYCCLCGEVRTRPACEHKFTRIPGLKIQHCYLCGFVGTISEKGSLRG